MNEKSLLNKSVAIYLDGGWQVSGTVKIFEKEKIIIENQGVLSLIMREKVSCLTLLDDSYLERVDNNKDVEQKELPRSNKDFPMNGISYEDSTLTIPMSLYGMEEDPDDFSISFAKNNDSKISFGLDGEKNDTGE